MAKKLTVNATQKVGLAVLVLEGLEAGGDVAEDGRALADLDGHQVVVVVDLAGQTGGGGVLLLGRHRHLMPGGEFGAQAVAHEVALRRAARRLFGHVLDRRRGARVDVMELLLLLLLLNNKSVMGHVAMPRL